MDSLIRVCRKDTNGAAAQDSCGSGRLACHRAAASRPAEKTYDEKPGSLRVCSEKTAKRRGREIAIGCNVTLPPASPEQTCDPGDAAQGLFHGPGICLKNRNWSPAEDFDRAHWVPRPLHLLLGGEGRDEGEQFLRQRRQLPADEFSWTIVKRFGIFLPHAGLGRPPARAFNPFQPLSSTFDHQIEKISWTP